MKYSVYDTWTIVSSGCLSIDDIYTDKELAEKDCAELIKQAQEYSKTWNPRYSVMTVYDAIDYIKENKEFNDFNRNY